MQNQKRKLWQALKTMRSQKAEVDSLQCQLAQSAQKIRSSVERELRETFQAVKLERDRFSDLVTNLECGAKDMSQKLATMSEEVSHGKEELRLANSNIEDLKLDLQIKKSQLAEEADKVARLEQQLVTKSHRCNALEQELNHIKQKSEDEARSRKVIATQTPPEFNISEQDNYIAGLEDKLTAAERRTKDAVDQLSRTAKERDSLREQLNDVTESSSVVQLQLDEKSALVTHLELDLKQLADVVSRLERTVLEKEKKVQMVEHVAGEMKSRVSSLMAENVVLKQRIKQQSDDDKLNSLVASLKQKNSELTSHVSNLTKELQSKKCSEKMAVLQKDGECPVIQHQQRQQCEDNAVKNVGFDVLKKLDDAELHDSAYRHSELMAYVDSLKRDLQTVETSHRQKVAELEGKVAELNTKLASTKCRTCLLERKRIPPCSEAAVHDSRTNEDRLVEPLNILPLMLTPIEVEQTKDAAVTPEMLPGSSSDATVDGRLDADEKQQLIRILHSRIEELEEQLDRSNSGRLEDEHSRMMVSIHCVCNLSNVCGLFL